MNERQLKRAAHWIFRRRNGPDWWTHLVLTKYNSDPTRLGYSEQDARRIFEVLLDKDLVSLDGEISGDGFSIPRYKFNFAKLGEWKKEVNWIERFIPGWILLFVVSWWKALVFCFLIIITAFLEDAASRLGDIVWTRVFPSHNANEDMTVPPQPPPPTQVQTNRD